MQLKNYLIYLEISGTLKYVPDCYKNQEMGNKVVEIYPRALECYKTQKMCDKAVDIYPSTIKFVPERYKTKEIYHKAVHRCFFIFYSIPDKCKTQEICNFAVFLYFPFIAYCPYKYVTQEMRDEAVNYSLAALKFIGLLQVKLIKNFCNALYADENILYFNKDSGDAVFNYNEMAIVNIDLNNFNLDNNFDKEDPNTVILIRPLVWHINFEKNL